MAVGHVLATVQRCRKTAPIVPPTGIVITSWDMSFRTVISYRPTAAELLLSCRCISSCPAHTSPVPAFHSLDVLSIHHDLSHTAHSTVPACTPWKCQAKQSGADALVQSSTATYMSKALELSRSGRSINKLLNLVGKVFR